MAKQNAVCGVSVHISHSSEQRSVSEAQIKQELGSNQTKQSVNSQVAMVGM